MNEFRVKEHLRTQKSLVAYIDVYRLATVAWLVVKLLELVAEVPLPILVSLLLVVLLELSCDIFAHVAILFFDGSGNLESVFRRHRLLSVTKVLKSEFCDVSTG